MNPLSRTLKAAVRPLAIRILLAWERIESGVAYNPLSLPPSAPTPIPSTKNSAASTPSTACASTPAGSSPTTPTWTWSCATAAGSATLDATSATSPKSACSTWTRPGTPKSAPSYPTASPPRSVAALEPRIRETVDDLLQNVDGKPRFDLIQEIAFPLPVIVIAEMLGVPPEDREQFNEWSNVVSLTVDPLLNQRQIREVQKAVDEVFAYFEVIAEERRRDPKDDLVSALVTAEVDGERLERDDLLVNLLLILVAGNETTRNLIGNGSLTLLRNPDQLQRLSDDPSLLPSAIDELLRFDSPVQLDSRIAREPIEIRGKRIDEGQRVLCLLGAANRDPQVFPNPDQLDVSRSAANHMAFGRGIHYCLGFPLAKLEGRVVFEALLPRLANLRLAEEPRYRNQVTLRGLEALWLEPKN